MADMVWEKVGGVMGSVRSRIGSGAWDSAAPAARLGLTAARGRRCEIMVSSLNPPAPLLLPAEWGGSKVEEATARVPGGGEAEVEYVHVK